MADPRATLEHYSTTVRLLGDGVAIIDADGIVRSLNPAGERMLGADAEFLVGKKLLETPWRTVNEDGTRRPREEHPALIALQTGVTQLDERVGLLRPGGDVAWISVTAVPLENPDGGPPMGVVVSFRDISRRFAADAALAESQRQLDLIFNATSDFILLLAVRFDASDEPRFSYEAANAAYARLIGQPASAVIGKSIEDALPGHRLGFARDLLLDALTKGEVHRRTTIVFPVGLTVADIVIRVVDRDERGRPRRLLAVGRDITAQATSEFELRESEARFRAMAESLSEGAAITDLDDRALYVNSVLCEMTGYSREELEGRILADVIFTPAGRVEVGRRTEERKAGISARYQVEMIRKNGEHRWVEIGGAPFRDSSGAIIGTVGTITDVTDRHSADQARAQIVGIVSHELRTPLTALTGSLKLLERGVSPSDTRVAKLVELAVRNSQRLLRLVNDLLDLERMESGTPVLDIADIDIRGVAERAIEVVAPLADDREIHLELEPGAPMVRADADRILQVLINLVGNAIKFSPNGATVTIGAVQRGSMVHIFVRDQGRGIPEDRLPTLFQRFAQVDIDDARRKKGAGLGLAISRAIVDQHGGRIWAESPPSGGSVFRFTLPAARAGDVPE